jgi:hypothetical protein
MKIYKVIEVFVEPFTNAEMISTELYFKNKEDAEKKVCELDYKYESNPSLEHEHSNAFGNRHINIEYHFLN